MIDNLLDLTHLTYVHKATLAGPGIDETSMDVETDGDTIQCGDDFARDNIMKQAVNLKDVEVPVLLPGVRLNTSATSYHAIDGMQLQKFDGKNWVLFGETLKDKGNRK